METTEKILSYERYSEKIAAYRKSGKQGGRKIYTNCFFLKGELVEKIEEGTLAFCEKDGNLYLLEDCGGFFRLYYYAQNLEGASPLGLDKRAALEFPFREGLTEQQLREIEFIEGLDFRLGRESRRMSVNTREIRYLDERMKRIYFRDPRVQVGPAVPEEQERIKKLIYDTFNPMYAYLPDDAQLRERIQKGEIYVMRFGDELVAVDDLDLFGGKVTGGRLLVADRKFRGGGWGAVLFNACLELVAERAEKFFLWVDIANVEAIETFKRFGFLFDGMCANEYVFGTIEPSIR